MESIRQANRINTLLKRKELGIGDGSSNKNSGPTVIDEKGNSTGSLNPQDVIDGLKN